jgi:hypothetical protein
MIYLHGSYRVTPALLDLELSHHPQAGCYLKDQPGNNKGTIITHSVPVIFGDTAS